LFSYAKIIIGEMPTRSIRVGILFLAVLLAALTYFLVEKPIRFGKAKGVKAVVLLVGLVVIGSLGGAVFWEKGLPERQVGKNAVELLKDLEVPLGIGATCRQRYGSKSYVCDYHDVGGKQTVALLGDSHAQYAAPVFAEYLEKKGYNTLFLASGGGGENSVNGKLAPPQMVQAIFEHIRADTRIQKVFLITRGVLYIKGSDHDSPYPNPNQGSFYGSGTDFALATQQTIDQLRQMGKSVYLVAENPVWPGMGKDPTAYIRALVQAQPLRNYFNPKIKEIHLYKKDVLEHQKEYLEALKSLKGVTVLHTIDAFCPEDECLLLDKSGLPLYWDDDHLSQRTGGKFLLEKVLKPHLDN
jgi:hypothetical protein